MLFPEYAETAFPCGNAVSVCERGELLVQCNFCAFVRRKIGNCDRRVVLDDLVFNTVNVLREERVFAGPELDGVENDSVKEAADPVANSARDDEQDFVYPLVLGDFARVVLVDRLDARERVCFLVGVTEATGKREHRGGSGDNECDFGFFEHGMYSLV